MRLRCKSCGAGIEARDINLAALKADCIACGGKFHFGQEDVPPVGQGVAGEAEVPAPKHVKVSQVDGTLLIRRSWRDGPLDWMVYVILAWYALLGLAAWQLWWAVLPWQQIFQLTILLMVLAMAGVLGIYAFLQGLCNSTDISVNDRALRISHGPVRFSRRSTDWDFEAAAPQIRQIYGQMAINPSSGPSIHGAYDLHVILHNGVHEVAMHGIPREDEAIYLCQQIRKRLQLPGSRLEQSGAPEQVPRPEKIEVDIAGNTLSLVYRFGTLLTLTPAILLAAVGVIAIFVLSSTSALEGRGVSWLQWPLAPMLAGEVLIILLAIRLACRRRMITVDPKLLTIEEVPSQISQRISHSLRSTEQFYCTARPRRLRPPWRTGTALAFTYEVWAITGEGKHLPLIRNLPTSDEAFFIEQEIERHLGLEDTVVKGEITRPGSAKALDLQRLLNQRHDVLAALKLESGYATGQQYPASLRQVLRLYHLTGDDTLLHDASRILQLPINELERVMWELEEAPPEEEEAAREHDTEVIGLLPPE